ncbi:MAG: zinc ribbon domain-containing protein [Pseudohongiellaceae bacterium]|nr:zinc ribbon domain-containing protein [Pseudohongiellaceae bacterium]
MPIYDYRCESCGHVMEALQKISDEPLKDCPQCKSASLQKQVSASSFRLKGGGWYETDFKTGARKHGTQDSAGGGKPSSAD